YVRVVSSSILPHSFSFYLHAALTAFHSFPTRRSSDLDDVRAALAASPSMDGLDLATAATIAAEHTEGPADARHHIVALWDEAQRSEEHTSELQSRVELVCRLLLEKKKTNKQTTKPIKT